MLGNTVEVPDEILGQLGEQDLVNMAHQLGIVICGDNKTPDELRDLIRRQKLGT